MAYDVANTVAAIDPAGASTAKGIEPGDVIQKVELVPTSKEQIDLVKEMKMLNKPIDLRDGKVGWPNVQFTLQALPLEMPVKLTLLRFPPGPTRGPKEGKTVEATVSIVAAKGWFNSFRGMVLQTMSETRKVDSWGDAFVLGLRETKESVQQTATTVRKLATGGVSLTNLGGPGTIFVVATASASAGIARLLIFLTFLSANLAVLNFLPIPILDGGHMMFLLYEGIRGKPASERAMIVLTYLGLAFILTLMLFALGMDLFRGFHWLTGLFQ